MKSAENILRSLFISLFPLAALLIFIYTILHYLEIGFSWQIVSVLIMAIAVIIFFVGLFIKPWARTDANLKTYSFFIAIGFIFSVLALILVEPLHLNYVSLSLFLGIGWVLYLRWYAFFNDRKNELLKVGKQWIEFGLKNSDKNNFIYFLSG